MTDQTEVNGMHEKPAQTPAVPEKPGGNGSAPGAVPPPPQLPNSFFQELLDLPTCKTEGYCNNCGRCER